METAALDLGEHGTQFGLGSGDGRRKTTGLIDQCIVGQRAHPVRQADRCGHRATAAGPVEGIR